MLWMPPMEWMSRLRDRVDDWRFGTIDESAALGRRGEQAAARLLRQRGLKVIVESESDRRGEIDLIAMGRGSRLMVFVEVKTLASLRPGHPADRVDEAKQRRITRAALRYLRRQRLIGVPCRFDVVAVWWPRHERRPTKIEHYEAAFEAQGVDSFFT